MPHPKILISDCIFIKTTKLINNLPDYTDKSVKYICFPINTKKINTLKITETIQGIRNLPVIC